MRPSSACARCVLLAASVAIVSCAHPKITPVGEATVTIEGQVALAGDSLDNAIVLEDAGGRVCALTSPVLDYELRSLAGLVVRVTGKLLGSSAGGPEFLVESYELMPVNGQRPVVGVIAAGEGAVILTDSRSGATYLLVGPLAGALGGYTGFKVWVSGPVAPAAATGSREDMMTVESYGVLVPVAGATGRTP